MKIPLSLYIHIPWCVRKCPYCDFNSHQAAPKIPETEYVTSLIQDLQQDLQQYAIDRPLHSIFIGGGTPSLFSGGAIRDILTAVDHHWGIGSNVEITLEANPGTVEQKNFAAYKQAGVNRLSLGIQSFDEEKLKVLGRIHSGAEARQAIDVVHAAGFENFNVDLMFGLPQQTIEQGLADLQQAIALQPTHISWYQLTLEPNTVFYKHPPRLPDQDLIADLQDQGQALLSEQGYQQYEISAYATDNKICQHNLNYWQFGDYLGIGAGAHGKITLPDNSIVRTRKVKQPASYLKVSSGASAASREIFLIDQKHINAGDLQFEYFLNRLRLNTPILRTELPSYIALDPLTENSPLTQAIEKGFLQIDIEKITKTPLGQRFLNDLLLLFL